MQHFNKPNDLERLIKGDELAFRHVFDQYSGRIYRLAFRFLKNAEQSEEIVQETFIKLWTSRQRLDPSGNLWLYLYVIAKRLSFNALREISKSAVLTEKLIYHITEIHNRTEEDILANELETYTENLISQLPRQQQLIFKLSRVDGLSHKEIAEQLHISQNTVKNHMVDALKTIKARLRYADLIYFLILIFWQ